MQTPEVYKRLRTEHESGHIVREVLHRTEPEPLGKGHKYDAQYDECKGDHVEWRNSTSVTRADVRAIRPERITCKPTQCNRAMRSKRKSNRDNIPGFL